MLEGCGGLLGVIPPDNSDPFIIINTLSRHPAIEAENEICFACQKTSVRKKSVYNFTATCVWETHAIALFFACLFLSYLLSVCR